MGLMLIKSPVATSVPSDAQAGQAVGLCSACRKGSIVYVLAKDGHAVCGCIACEYECELPFNGPAPPDYVRNLEIGAEVDAILSSGSDGDELLDQMLDQMLEEVKRACEGLLREAPLRSPPPPTPRLRARAKGKSMRKSFGLTRKQWAELGDRVS